MGRTIKNVCDTGIDLLAAIWYSYNSFMNVLRWESE